MGCGATSGNGILQDVTMKLKPKFCRLNSKAQKRQKMEEVGGNSRLSAMSKIPHKVRRGAISLTAISYQSQDCPGWPEIVQPFARVAACRGQASRPPAFVVGLDSR